MKLKTKLSKLRHDGHITDAEYSIIINALNKKTKERVQQPCKDYISRQAAIDAVQHAFDRETLLNSFVRKVAVDALKTMPSAQPKVEPCEDCISREEAIRVAEQGQIQGYEWQFKKLCNLPSVTPWSDWIPVSEKLPEPLTAVLLTVRYKSSGCLTYQTGYWEDALEKWEKWLEIGTLDDEFEVLAWMELPERYWEDDHE